MSKKRNEDLEFRVERLEDELFEIKEKASYIFKQYKKRAQALEEYLGVEFKPEYHEPVVYKFEKKDGAKGDINE